MSFINSEDVRQYINTNIRTNGRRQISGAVMNVALNGLLQLAETRQGSGIIIQNYPTPSVFTQRQPGSIWLQPLKGMLHVIDDNGAWLYMMLPPMGIFGDGRYEGLPNYNNAIESFDMGITGVRECMNTLGIPVSVLVTLLQRLKEHAAQKLLQTIPGQNLHVIYDKPDEKKALLETMYKMVAGAAVYYNPALEVDAYFNATQACVELQAEQPQLLQQGGLFYTVFGRKLFAEVLLLVVNGIRDFKEHPNAGNATVELKQEQGDRSMAISIIASYFDRIAATVS
jgi:hypothetical protein